MKMWTCGETLESPEKLRRRAEKMEEAVEKHSEGRPNA